MKRAGINGRGSARPTSYFFLSYAHSPPLAGMLEAKPDEAVRRFFFDLTDRVNDRATPHSGIAPGYFDQDERLNANWRESLTNALGNAQVFVPLYSPGYFARSWPGREWASFHRRLTDAGLADPLRRFAPVLWTPLPDDQDAPGLQETLRENGSVPEYADNGLRALLRLSEYRGAYDTVVDRLARRIVDLAENAPISPSRMHEVDGVQSAFHPEAAPAVFAVAVAAPTLSALPDGRDPATYATERLGWHPFTRDEQLPLVDYAARAAEWLDFAVVVSAIEKTGDMLGSRPGVLLIDPWFVAETKGERLLESFVHDLPRWVLPALVVEPGDERGALLAERVRSILGATMSRGNETVRRATRGIGTLEDFVALMPHLVSEAERQYLRHGPVFRARGTAGTRLLMYDDRPTSRPAPEEEPDG